MKLQQLIEQYVTYRKSLGECQITNASTLRAFSRAVGAGADIVDVHAEHVNAFLTGSGPITLNWHVKFSFLRPFFHYAVSRGYIPTAPLPDVIPKRPPPFVPYIFSHEDLRRLLDVVDSDQRRQVSVQPITMRTVILLLYGAGMRIQEAIDLNRVDVDLGNSLLTVHQTKFGKTRLIPFGAQLGSALARYAKRVPACRAEAPFFMTKTNVRTIKRTLQYNFRLSCERAAGKSPSRAVERASSIACCLGGIRAARGHLPPDVSKGSVYRSTSSQPLERA